MASDSLEQFLVAASAPRDATHTSGALDRAEELRTAHPTLVAVSIHAAAVLGEADAVARLLERDATLARAPGGPHDWDPLTYLCFSRYLRLDPSRSEGFVQAATALLDAGADPDTGWYEKSHLPSPVWESALYGAAGVAHHPELTRLLLARGANPNDDETPYHAPETYDNRALEALVESRALNDDSLVTLLLRKADWHDGAGIRYLLERGADPNRMTRWRHTAFQQSLLRDNDIGIIELLLDHGADPTLSRADGTSGIALAARRGRRDVLALVEARGYPLDLSGVDRLVLACAQNDEAEVESLAAEAALLAELRTQGGSRLAEFAGVGNTEGVRMLLDLGVPVDASYSGDGYWGVTPGSTALHMAAWRARHRTVGLLIERGAPINAPDDAGRTPLALAVKACVDSHWTESRSPMSVAALLEAGAHRDGITLPTGYDAVDALLAP